MLARTFLTAAQLGIPDVEHQALIDTLLHFESGVMQDDVIDMRRFKYSCGTPACMCGWANHLSNGLAFPEVSNNNLAASTVSFRLNKRLPHQLLKLFHIGSSIPKILSVAEAAAQLSNYLTTGFKDR